MSTNTDESLSTESNESTSTQPFDVDEAWQIHRQVSVRPERFGALLYHFGTRRLSFLKDPKLLTVVRSLETHDSARAACTAAGVADAELPSYRAALTTLATSSMIEPRHFIENGTP